MLPLALALLLAGSDVFFEQTTVVAVSGKPPGPGVVSRVYHSGRKLRLEAGEVASGAAFVLRLDQERAFRLEPQARQAVLLDLPALRARSHLDLALAGELMGGSARARTTRLTRGRSVAGYACEGYRISAGSTVMDLYTTRELPLTISAYAELLEWSGAAQALPGLMEAIRELPGFPLETRSRVTALGEVHETRTTVTRLKVGPLEAGLFEVPQGYAVVPEAVTPP